MTSDHTAPIKYIQISQRLYAQIKDGVLPPNKQLPTEYALTKQFSVSRGTVRKAIDLLENEGVVRREQGRGTFVNEVGDQPLARFELNNFYKEMRLQQRQPRTQLLKQEVVGCSAEIAPHLDLAIDTPVIHIVRLKFADDQPIIYEERYLNAQLCPQLATENLEQQSIHWLLVHQYKLPLVKVTHTVEMREVGVDSAELLALQPHDSVFAIERITYTKINNTIQPAVYYRALCRGDEYQFKAKFNSLI